MSEGKQLSELNPASQALDTDLLLLQQDGEAKKITVEAFLRVLNQTLFSQGISVDQLNLDVQELGIKLNMLNQLSTNQRIKLVQLEGSMSSLSQRLTNVDLELAEHAEALTYQVDDWLMDEEGYLYLLAGGKVAIGPIGPFQAGGGTGGTGADGFSPIANVTQTDSGATITITDKSGTTMATIVNGKDGADGKDGKDGAQGIQGEQGPKGDTGAPGADGAKGDKGDTGEPGPAGADGKDGSDGKDGVSATHRWSGTTLTITSASGTSSANLKGEKGDKGDKGDQGIQGIQGEKGDTGAPGSNGTNGKDGANGTSVTVKSVSESTADGGSNVVTFSDGKTLTVKNGSKGSKGDKGDKGDTGATGATGAAGKDAVATMFISPDGNDSNDGLTASTPKKTVKACVTAGAKRISAKRGVYKENVLLTNISELEILPTDNDLTYAVGVEREPIVFDTSDTVAVSNLAAYNSIKRVAYSNSANTQFDKVFTKKSQTPIYGDGNGSRYNATIWLLSSDEKTVCIKLKPVLTVAECEAEANTFTYVSGYIYINANMASVAKIVVPTNWDCGIYINGAERFVLKEVEVRFAGSYNIDIRNCAYFDFYKCACKYTSYGSGFHPFNSNGKLTACYATKNYDGYGISGYGHTTYVDCVSEFNFDDGMSHHNATTGTVIGGRYEGNGKGGNVPAYGAKVNIYGGLYKDNASFGIGYLWATDLEPASGMVQGAVMVGNPIGLSVQKNCDVTAMNCTYKDNATDKDAKGNLTEYNANYVKTVNGVAPDENGNVVVSGGGEPAPAYTNLLPLATDASGAVFNGTGYKNGYRLNSSAVEKQQSGCGYTGFIRVKSHDVVRIKNYGLCTSGYHYYHLYSSDFAHRGGKQEDALLAPDSTGMCTITIPQDASIAYVRFSIGEFSEDTIITVNEEITE